MYHWAAAKSAVDTTGLYDPTEDYILLILIHYYETIIYTVYIYRYIIFIIIHDTRHMIGYPFPMMVTAGQPPNHSRNRQHQGSRQRAEELLRQRGASANQGYEVLGGRCGTSP